MTARIEAAHTGTTLHVTVAGLPVNEHCTLVVVARDGSRRPAGAVGRLPRRPGPDHHRD